MSQGDAQKFIKRNRPPRVNISYADPYNSDKTIELPFVMGVMSDLSGNASEVEKPPVGERDMLPIDMDNFDKRIAAVAPAMTFRVADKLSGEAGRQLGVKIAFKSMSDFEPAAVAQQIPELAVLMEARDRLSHLLSYMDGKSAAEDKLRELLANPELLKLMADRTPEKAQTQVSPGGGSDKA